MGGLILKCRHSFKEDGLCPKQTIYLFKMELPKYIKSSGLYRHRNEECPEMYGV